MGFGFGGIGTLLFFGVIIWAIFTLVRRGGIGAGCCGPGYLDSHSHSLGHNSALDTLKERYAKGEISKEEYEKIKQDIIG